METNTARANITPEQDGLIYAGNLMMEHIREKEASEERSKRPPQNKHGENHLNKPFSDTELQKTPKKLNKRKSPGTDNVTNKILQHMGPTVRHKFLDILNGNWIKGDVP